MEHIKILKYYCCSFPHSNTAFAYPLPAENKEAFKGLKQLFHQAGGVPTHLRIHNPSAAVITIEKGENRIDTEAFLQFQMHYNFGTQPCNPIAGMKKVMLSVKLVIHVIIGLQLHRLRKVFHNCTVATYTSIRRMKNDRIMITKS
ncbi:hypothetical protein [Bacillus thuringiensis]|uniref:hypothetical protein n=1 Tax=Bacillus thuringiensis TaxID=1428 RepID=UPI003BF7E621